MAETFVKFLLGILLMFSLAMITYAAPTNITANVNVTETESERSFEPVVEEVASNVHVPFDNTKHDIDEGSLPSSNAMMQVQALPINTLPPNYHRIPMVDGDYTLNNNSDSNGQVEPSFRDIFLKSMLDYLVRNSSQDNVHLFSNHLVKSVGHSLTTDTSKGTSDDVTALDGSHPSGVSKRYTEDSEAYYDQNMQAVPQGLNHLDDLLEEEQENFDDNSIKTELVKDLSSPVVVKPIIINVPQTRLPSHPHLQGIHQDDLQFYPYGGRELRRFGRYIDQEPSYNMIQTLPQQHQDVPNNWYVYGKHNYLILQGGNLHLPDGMALYEENDLKRKNNKRDNMPHTGTDCEACKCKAQSQSRKKDESSSNWQKESSSSSSNFLNNLMPSFSEPKKSESIQMLPESKQISSTHSRQMLPYNSNNFNVPPFGYDALTDQNEFAVKSDSKQFYEGMSNNPNNHESDRDKTLAQPFVFKAQY